VKGGARMAIDSRKISQMPIERSRRHATTDLFLGERQ
jgi:hypothetical protein